MAVSLVMVIMGCLSGQVMTAHLTCQNVPTEFAQRGIAFTDYPPHPLKGTDLEVCPRGATCCSRDMESRLGDWAIHQYRETVSKRTQIMANPFQLKAKRVDDTIQELISNSQGQLHNIFTRTYGVLYERNALLFRKYFRQLKTYYQRGNINLQEATSRFFTTLYQKMFQVMNSQYRFDDAYLNCVASHMEEQRPFGDIPKKVANSVKKSLVASRALSKALKSGFQIAEEMRQAKPTKECLNAVQRLNSCSVCQGYSNVKPCNSFCLNVMKGCLAYHIELQDHWNKFIDALISLADRLSGPFNVESVILPLDINISDAIMNLQESGFQITQRVFEVCQTPRLVTRDAAPNPQFGHNDGPRHVQLRTNAQRAQISSRGKSGFDKLIADLRKMVRKTQGFWSTLPYQMCISDHLIPLEVVHGSGPISGDFSSSVNETSTCWNGNDHSAYKSAVVEDGLAQQIHNPEVEIKFGDAILKERLFKLESITNQLRLAHRGQDVQWWDDAGARHDEGSKRDLNKHFEGSGELMDEGSSQFGVDDEDFSVDEGGSGNGAWWEAEAGSGLDCDDEDGCHWRPDSGSRPSNTPSSISTTTTTTPRVPDIQLVDDDEQEDDNKEDSVTTHDESPTAGASSTLKVMKAVIVFLLPTFTCWISQVFTDAWL